LERGRRASVLPRIRIPLRPESALRLITADRVIALERDLTPGTVEIESGRIARVRAGRVRRSDIDIKGVLAPGLIDLQINGAAGADFLTGEAAEIDRARRYLLSTGTTSFLPTLITAPEGTIEAALDRWQARRDGAPRVLGVHVEGPFLNPAHPGAHEARYLRPPRVVELRRLLRRHPGLVKVLTLAPELRGARALIREARRRGIVVSAGHTAATYAEGRAAFAGGVRLVTHLFNAMRPLRHRDPGIVAASLQDPRVTVSVIADLVHVDSVVLQLVLAAKPHHRIALITDAVAAAGHPGRTSRLAGRTLRVTDAPRLPDGTLAGSVLRMDQAVRNVVSLGVPVRDAIGMASAVPAALLGRRDLGRIGPGARADLVLFDRDLRVRTVLIDGAVVHQS
jgi:N-acetylglucosamine-6-phosphate deacetylase